MSLTAFLLVLASVFLHAGWNFISKKSVPSLSFYCLSCGTAALLWLFPFLFSEFSCRLMPPGFWRLVAFSVCFEILYVGGLAYSYRKGDISMVYPLVRALPLLLTAAVTALFALGSRQPGPWALLGMLIIFVGCLCLPLLNFSQFKLSTYLNPLIYLILMAAVGVTGYTVLDSIAMREISELYGKKSILLSMSYLFFIEAGISIGALFLLLFNRNERLELARLLRRRSLNPVITGVFSSGAYVLILLSMNFVSNVSYIQAFRQLSLPIGVLAGILILKEPCSRPKIIGTALIVLGLAPGALFP